MNNSELFEFLPLMVDDERAYIYTISLILRILLSVVCTSSGLWVTAMKFFLFYNLMQEKISDRPINILIFIDQAVDYIVNIVIIINTSIKVKYFVDNNQSFFFTYFVLHCLHMPFLGL